MPPGPVRGTGRSGPRHMVEPSRGPDVPLEPLAARPLSQPHPDRLSPSRPDYGEILAAHLAALRVGASTYVDPAVGADGTHRRLPGQPGLLLRLGLSTLSLRDLSVSRPGHGHRRCDDPYAQPGSRRRESSHGMSDTSQGPGWWLASDGKWYPPEQWTGPPNTSPPMAPACPADRRPRRRSRGRLTRAGGQPGRRASGQPGRPGRAAGAASRDAAGLRHHPWPGSAPPAQPGYGTNPYGAAPYGQPGYGAAYGQPASSPRAAPRPTGSPSPRSSAPSSASSSSPSSWPSSSASWPGPRYRNSGGRQKGDGLAIAGIIIGFAWVAFYVLIIILGAVEQQLQHLGHQPARSIGHIA